MSASLRERLAGGELLLGTIVTLPAPAVAEILAAAGFDWLFIDTEHAVLGPAEAQALMQAAAGGCACAVRVPGAGESAVRKALDAGAEGVLVPQVNSAREAARVVDLCRYPPRGSRGVGVARAQGYGMRLAEYVAEADARVAAMVQVEHIDAVRSIEAIAGVAGLDAVFIGPYDLSASMGKPGRVGDADVQEAIREVLHACRAAHTAAGIFGVDAATVAPYIEQGFRLIAVGIDTLFLGRGAAEALARLRPADRPRRPRRRGR